MMPDTPSATPNATSYHPHSGYHINTDVHKKMTKGLKDGESVHVPNPEAHHIDGVALGQATGAASTGGILVTKNGIHPVARHDPRQHNTAEAHGPLTSRDIIAGHLGQQMHQLHEDNPDQAASTAMHIPKGHPATSAVHGTDHPAVTPSSGSTGSKPLRNFRARVQPWGAVGRFAANRGKGAAGSAVRRVATGVSNRAEGKSFWTGKDRPPSMTQRYHGFMRNNFPGYQPGMNPKQAVSTALKVTGDNIKASQSMRSRSTPTTTNAPPPRADATVSLPPRTSAGRVSAPKKSGPGFLDRSRMRTAARAKASAAKAKAAPKIETEAAPKVDSTKVKTPTPKIPTDAEQTAATTAASTPSGPVKMYPFVKPSLFGGAEFEKMLTFMKSTNYVVSSQGKMSAAYWADKEKW